MTILTCATAHLLLIGFVAALASSPLSNNPFGRKSTTLSSLSSSSSHKQIILNLQGQHDVLSPKEVLQSIASSCDKLGIESFDVYGDFSSDKESSYLRKFESQVAKEFGKEDAVFMPSGVMAQSIALLIHSNRHQSKSSLDQSNERHRNRFACHPTSHLLLWEEESYDKLLGMSAVEIGTKDLSERSSSSGVSIPPMRYADVEEIFDVEIQSRKDISSSEKEENLYQDGLHTLIIELPHRELGGKLTPWEEVLQIGHLCQRHGVKYHCDGARIFEASAGYGLALSELASPFDSVYISFYKGLGAISGAMLMGSTEFCKEARIWLRRFGGNLYTLLPYAVSCWSGYQKHLSGGEECTMTFEEKFDKLRRVVHRISTETMAMEVLLFDPPVPETNMVHCYIRASVEECEKARDFVVKEHGAKIFDRIREITTSDPLADLGYGARVEWTMGMANGSIHDNDFVTAWDSFSSFLIELSQDE